MKNKTLTDQAVELCSYYIGSGDMYYSVEEKRTIFISGDAQNGFRIWGQLVDIENAPTVGLDLLLLEEVMTCEVPGHLNESEKLGDAFAVHLGRAVAKHIIERTPGETANTRADLSLQCILYSLNATWSTQDINGGKQYQLDHCSLCAAAKRSGIQKVELGHHTLHTLLQSMAYTIDPRLTVHQPANHHAEHIFAIKA